MGRFLTLNIVSRSQRIKSTLRHIFFTTAARRYVVFLSGGLAVGLIATLFAHLCGTLEDLFLSMVSYRSYPALFADYYWIISKRYLPLLIMPLGFPAILYLTEKYFKGAEGSGIPRVIQALGSEDISVLERLLSVRVAVGKFLLTAASFLCGASVGREGPTVLLGSSIMYAFSKTKLATFKALHLRNLDRGLVIAGGAAGIAAAFNTPLGGVLFAIEELSKSFDVRLSKPLILSIILSGFVCQFLLTNKQYFGHSIGGIPGTVQWVIVPLCGLIGGFFGGLFSRLLVLVAKHVFCWPLKKRLYWAGTCGLLVAMIGILTNGQTFTSGYVPANELITGAAQFPAYFGITKLLATLLSYVSGIPGGIFAPSLSAGAGFGDIVAQWFPKVSHSAVVILGMTAYFTGVVRSPITCFVIVIEMTGRNDLILPLMAVTIIADIVSVGVCRQSLYEALANISNGQVRRR